MPKRPSLWIHRTWCFWFGLSVILGLLTAWHFTIRTFRGTEVDRRDLKRYTHPDHTDAKRPLRAILEVEPSVFEDHSPSSFLTRFSNSGSFLKAARWR